MTKEEYQNSINELEERKREIEQEYISSNTEFKIGDKVKVISESRTRIGYITGFKISCVFHGIEPIVYKSKKDGSKSLVGEIHIYGNEKIEKYSE